MKVVAIFCKNLGPNGDPFADPYYWDAYSDLLLILNELGASAYFVSKNATYEGSGRFSAAYTLDHKGTVNDLRNAGSIQADIVFDRGEFTGRDIPVINPEFVSNVGASKITTYQLFAQHQPLSLICQNKTELLAAIKTIPGHNIVVKKPDSTAGKGIYIANKKDILPLIPGTYPLLVQEFLDTSAGIPGLIEGAHDLRVEIGGGEIWGCYIRQPKPGEYKANIAQGGSKIILSHKDVPSEVVAMVRQIDAYFEDYPRFYGVDFAYTPKGWKLIEINSKRLGLVATSGGPGSRHTLYKLANYLISEAG